MREELKIKLPALLLGIIAVLLISVAGCASEAKQQAATSRIMPDAAPHQLKVVNQSADVINAIQYKPCGSKPEVFQTLAENLKPKQTVVFNVFNECVDVKATNTFDQTLAERDELTLSTANIWTIK